MPISDSTVILPIAVYLQSFCCQITLLPKSYSQLASQDTLSKDISIFFLQKGKTKNQKNPEEIRMGDLKAIFILIAGKHTSLDSNNK